MIKPLAAAALAAAVQLAAPSAHATAPVYQGHYTLDSTVAGSVAAESGPYGTPDNWSLWTFDAPFMAVVTLTITPSSPDLDLYAAVFYGTESSLAHYTDMVGATASPRRAPMTAWPWSPPTPTASCWCATTSRAA
ncbi:hypothetical protein [uncultured Aquabacterium sp.]|uniref:hypothetical protein n=1 Tax=Aquabacterium sp. TaxID=1872578 RepID=UPI0025F68539|nr:hypothetical protein [uncultured Aquabacterium sp.]